MPQLVDAFLDGAEVSVDQRAALAEALAASVARAQRAWPSLVVELDRFARYLAERLAPGADPVSELAVVDVEGLYLACVCAAGQPSALALFDQHHRGDMERALARMGLDPALREELLAETTERLFFGGGVDGAAPSILSFRGRGTLRSWAQSVAVHAALKLRRKTRPLLSIEQLAAELPADQTDPEMVYLRGFYLDQFHAALSRAMSALPKESRTLLRQHYLDKMSLPAVAKVHRVHRATAARWLAEARQAVLKRTRDELMLAHGLRPSEVDSVIAFVRRQSSFGVQMSKTRDRGTT